MAQACERVSLSRRSILLDTQLSAGAGASQFPRNRNINYGQERVKNEINKSDQTRIEENNNNNNEK